jgi:hypothetical protein
VNEEKAGTDVAQDSSARRRSGGRDPIAGEPRRSSPPHQ